MDPGRFQSSCQAAALENQAEGREVTFPPPSLLQAKTRGEREREVGFLQSLERLFVSLLLCVECFSFSKQREPVIRSNGSELALLGFSPNNTVQGVRKASKMEFGRFSVQRRAGWSHAWCVCVCV